MTVLAGGIALPISLADSPDPARRSTVAPVPDDPGDPGRARCRTVSPMSETAGAVEQSPPSARERTPDIRTGRANGWLVAGALVLLTVALRLPAFLSSRHLVFDDGTYGVSVLDMRHGLAPYRGVFSAQGPLHF